MADANDNPGARWQRICGCLSSAGIVVPAAAEPGGTIIEGKVRVGVWLMPDNQSPGELEDFVRRMIPEDDPVRPLAKRYIEAIPSEHRKFRDKKTTRRLVSNARIGGFSATNSLFRDLRVWRNSHYSPVS